MGALDKWISKGADAAKSAVKSKLKGFVKGGEAKGSTDPNLNNRNYMVLITQDNGNSAVTVTGTVPQSFQIQQSVDWKAPWGAGIGGTVGDLLAVSTGNRLVAQVMTMQVWQGSGNDFEFTVQFELRAWSDPVRDVLEPLRALLKMSLPSLGDGGFLKSPGPVLTPEGIKIVSGQFTKLATVLVKDAASALTTDDKTQDGEGSLLAVTTTAEKRVKESGLTSKSAIEKHLINKINIQIGRWFRLNNVIITQVQHDIKGQTPDRATGVIQSASVTVSFKPMFSLTAEDVNEMLRAGG